MSQNEANESVSTLGVSADPRDLVRAVWGEGERLGYTVRDVWHDEEDGVIQVTFKVKGVPDVRFSAHRITPLTDDDLNHLVGSSEGTGC